VDIYGNEGRHQIYDVDKVLLSVPMTQRIRMIIRNIEHYIEIRDYLVNYITTLESKSHVQNKHYLIEIKNDLETTGYLNDHFKYQFFLLFLEHDLDHANINIKEYLYCLKPFKKHIEKQKQEINRITQHSHTLEDYLI